MPMVKIIIRVKETAELEWIIKKISEVIERGPSMHVVIDKVYREEQ